MVLKFSELSENNNYILVTRPLANRFKEHLNSEVDANNDDTIEFDFTNIKAVDSSFFDEMILKLKDEMESGKLPRRYIFLSHMSNDVEYEARMIFEAKKQPILVKLDNVPGWDLLFRVEPNLREVLNLVMKHMELTTSELKPMLDLPANTASMRFIKLHKKGLVKRKERISNTGREYIYSSLF